MTHVKQDWVRQLSLAEKIEKKWRERSKKIITRYRDEQSEWMRSKTRFNILWSNIETLRPALYNQTPKPDVRGRFYRNDEISQQASMLIERSLLYCMDQYDFDAVMSQAIMDYLLVGRAVTRLRYHPKFDGDVLRDEKIIAEPVHWNDFRMSPAQRWEDVSWVAFKHHLSQEQVTEKFGDFTDIKLELFEIGETRDELKRVVIWEIWDKTSRQVIFLAPGIPDGVLSIEEDPFNLEGFFPMPKPLYSFLDSSSLIPVPEFWCYKDQADELDRITDRIGKLVNAIKARGLYDARITEFSDLLRADDADLIPAENVALLIEKGGLDKAVWFLPIDTLSRVLVTLCAHREQIKQVIYEITGISDLLRGTSQLNETATAQNIKASYGNLRLQRRQREIQRYARDLLRVKAEMIAERFAPETLAHMTGIEMSDALVHVIKDHGDRIYRIDVETDSTIGHTLYEDQRRVTEMLGAIANFCKAVGPAVQMGAFSQEMAGGILEEVLKKFGSR